MTSPPMLDAEALLRELARARVEFVIIGGFALPVHGVIRGTKDIDIVPNPNPANLLRLAHVLRSLDAEVLLGEDFSPGELGLEPNEDGLALGGNWVLRTRLGRLDVMQDIPGMTSYLVLSAGAVERDVPGAGRFRFAGLDDLIAMKVAAGRPQDELDVSSLERARRTPDR